MTDSIQQRLVRRTAKDYVLYLPALLTSGVMSLLSVTVLSKVFRPAEYGNYVLASNLLVVLSMVTSLWLRGSIMRLVPQYQQVGKIRELIGTLILAGGIFMAVVMVTGSAVLAANRMQWEGELYRLYWIALIGVPLMTVFNCGLAAYRITERVTTYTAHSLIRVLGGFALGLVLAVPLHLGATGMMLGIVGMLAITAGAQVMTGFRKLWALAWPPRFAMPILRDMLAYNLPIVAMNLAAMIYSVADRYLIKGFYSSHEVGLYAVSYTVAEGSILLVARTLLTTAEPLIYHTWEQHGAAITYRFIESLSRYYFIMAAPVLVGLVLLRTELITLVSTAEYVDHSLTVVCVGGALFVHGYTLIIGSIFDATKRTVIPLVNSVIAALFVLGANVVLLPRFGYQAAAWTTLGSHVLLLMLASFSARRLVPLRFGGSHIWRVPLAAAGMGALLYTLRPLLASRVIGLVALVALGAAVYGALILAVGALTEHERRALSQRFSHLGMQLGRLSLWLHRLV